MEPKKTFKKPTDLEKFIGENLLNKIGIGILVLGIGYFVKYAFDMNMVSDWGKAGTGLLAGGLLIGIAHRLRDKYRAFSSVLVGGGLAVFYFTLTIAYKDFYLIEKPVAFIGMVVVSGLSVALSLMYNRKELAILSLLGGFVSPFLASDGTGNFLTLFSYIAILNAGMLVLSYFKRWHIINFLSFLCTAIIYSGWLGLNVFGKEGAPLLPALIFGAVFYLEFFYMNVVNNIRKGEKFQPREIFLLLANTGLFYSTGMFILQELGNGDYQGLFTGALAVLNFIFALTVYFRKGTDKVLLYLLTGLVLSFLSLVAPVQLQEYSITLFWACEAVLLIWLSQRSGIRLLRTGAFVITGLMLISLVMDWGQIYLMSDAMLPVVINKGFITSVVSIVSVFLTFKFLQRDPDEMVGVGVPRKQAITFYGSLVLALTFITGFLEMNFQITSRIQLDETVNLIRFAYFMTCVLGVLLVAKAKKMRELTEIFSVVAMLAGFSYWVINQSLVVGIRNAFLVDGTAGAPDFLFHYVILALAGALIYHSRKFMLVLMGGKENIRLPLVLLLTALGVHVASLELDHLVAVLGIGGAESLDALLTQNHKVGWPIMWGMISFGLLVVGMKKSFKALRITGLVLFSATLLKLFVFDLRGIPEFGKIAAFISLGVLLLIVSFMYQKLKVLLVDDPEAGTVPGQDDQNLPAETL